MPNKATGEDLPCRHRNKSGMIILIFNKGRTEAKWSMRTFFSPSLPDRQKIERIWSILINLHTCVCIWKRQNHIPKDPIWYLNKMDLNHFIKKLECIELSNLLPKSLICFPLTMRSCLKSNFN